MSVSALSEQLVKAGHTVSVFTTTANGKHELDIEPDATVLVNGVEVTYFERRTKDHSHFSPKLLSALAKRVNTFDVVHIHAWWNLVSVLSCVVALSKGAKVVVSPRGTLSSYSFQHKSSFVKKAFHALIGKKLLNKCAVHLTANSEQEELYRLIHPKQFYNIANFIDLPEAQYASDTSIHSPVKLLFLSRIDEKKGLDLLFDALALLTIDWNLSIAGDGNPKYIEHLQSLAQARQIHQHITWLGFRQNDKFDIYQEHDLFVLPSHNENFGNVVIESLSMGTPVIISKHVGLAAFVAEQDAGWVFDLDHLALKDAIETAVNQKEKMERIRKHGRKLIDQHFSKQVLINSYIKMYKQVTGHD